MQHSRAIKVSKHFDRFTPVRILRRRHAPVFQDIKIFRFECKVGILRWITYERKPLTTTHMQVLRCDGRVRVRGVWKETIHYKETTIKKPSTITCSKFQVMSREQKLDIVKKVMLRTTAYRESAEHFLCTKGVINTNNYCCR